MFKHFTAPFRCDPILGLIITLLTGLMVIVVCSSAMGQTYSPTPRVKTHILGEAFKNNNLRYIQFNRCSGEGKIREACKQNTDENAVVLNKPTGTFEGGAPTGKGMVKGYRSDDEAFTWVNDENVLTLSFPDRNECYFIEDGKYLVGVEDTTNSFDWKIMVNKK